MRFYFACRAKLSVQQTVQENKTYTLLFMLLSVVSRSVHTLKGFIAKQPVTMTTEHSFHCSLSLIACDFPVAVVQCRTFTLAII